MSEDDPTSPKFNFESTAYWRRQKAEEYPEDRRNLEAAAILDRLAETFDACPPDVVQRFTSLFLSDDGDVPIAEWQEELRSIGFSSAPATAEDCLRSFIASREG